MIIKTFDEWMIAAQEFGDLAINPAIGDLASPEHKRLDILGDAMDAFCAATGFDVEAYCTKPEYAKDTRH